MTCDNFEGKFSLVICSQAESHFTSHKNDLDGLTTGMSIIFSKPLSQDVLTNSELQLGSRILCCKTWKNLFLLEKCSGQILPVRQMYLEITPFQSLWDRIYSDGPHRKALLTPFLSYIKWPSASKPIFCHV